MTYSNKADTVAERHENDFSPLFMGMRLQEMVLTGFGVVLLLIGLYVSVQLVTTVWGLFQDHSLVVLLATEFEKHSHLNQVLQGSLKVFLPPSADAQKAMEPILSLNIAYFAAWVVAVLLLGLLGHLASLILSTGAKLVSAGKRQIPGVTRNEIRVILQDLVKELKER